MAVEIVHPVPEGEIPGWLAAMVSTFMEDPRGTTVSPGVARLAARWDAGARAWGARERGRWVATLRTERRRLTLPGHGADTEDVDVDALTNVTVAATHRRRGLLRTMLSASLRAARDRGDAVSILIAAEWGIYGRFGYAPAAACIDYTLDLARPGSAVRGDVTRVRAVEPEEMAELAPAAFERARRRRVGQVDRGELLWHSRLGTDGHGPTQHPVPHNLLVHDGPDGVDGLLGWTSVRESWLLPPLGAVRVDDLAAASDAAYVDLWAYLTGFDLVDELRLPARPLDEPIRWRLGDGRTLRGERPVDFLWLKLLDVPAALTARRYAVPGEIVLEVTGEALAVDVAGRYRLSADGDEVGCESTSAPAELAVDQRALASIYLGGYRVHELLAAGLAEELTPGAAARVASMFATPLAPWNATGF